jgi:hypothetical protein
VTVSHPGETGTRQDLKDGEAADRFSRTYGSPKRSGGQDALSPVPLRAGGRKRRSSGNQAGSKGNSPDLPELFFRNIVAERLSLRKEGTAPSIPCDQVVQWVPSAFECDGRIQRPPHRAMDAAGGFPTKERVMWGRRDVCLKPDIVLPIRPNSDPTCGTVRLHRGPPRVQPPGKAPFLHVNRSSAVS